VGVRPAVLEEGRGSGACGWWRRRVLPALLLHPGASLSEHPFHEDNRSHSSQSSPSVQTWTTPTPRGVDGDHLQGGGQHGGAFAVQAEGVLNKAVEANEARGPRHAA